MWNDLDMLDQDVKQILAELRIPLEVLQEL